MADILTPLLAANLALTAGIVVVLVMRQPTRQVFGAKLAYGLWLLPLLAALGSLLPARVVKHRIGLHPLELIFVHHVNEPASVPAPEALPAHLQASIPSIAVDPWLATGALWVVGFAAMLVWLSLRQIRFIAAVRRGEAGPAVVGFFRPRIVTPADFDQRFESREREIILAHEAVHIRRGDARTNALVALLRCLCWFNPFVHLGARAMRIDQELACDASVVERHPRERRLYADALLKTQLAAHPLPLGCYWPPGAEHPLTMRLAILKHDRPTAARRFLGAASLALLCGMVGLGGWAAEPPRLRVIEISDPQPAPTPQEVETLARKVPLAAAPARAPEKVAVPTIDAADPVYLRGQVEKIDFGTDSYTAYVRTSSIALDRLSVIVDDRHLWRLSPMHYWGDRDAVSRDLMNQAVNVSGVRTTRTCDPACGVAVQTFVKCTAPAYFTSGCLSGPKDAQDAQRLFETERRGKERYANVSIGGQPPGWYAFAQYFDADDPVLVTGVISKVEFVSPFIQVWLSASTVREGGQDQVSDNHLWRGDWVKLTDLSDDMRQKLVAGAEVTARGYNAKDKSCATTCRMNIQDLNFADGQKLLRDSHAARAVEERQ